MSVLKYLVFGSAVVGLLACEPAGVETNETATVANKESVVHDSIVSKLDGVHEVQDEKQLNNGITIKWFEWPC